MAALLENLLGHLTGESRERNANAGAYMQFDTGEDKCLSECGTDPVGDRLDLGGVFEVLTQYDVLVTRQTSHRISRPQKIREPVGDGGQQLIADMVTVCIVDRLESVEIDEEDGKHLFRSTGTQQGVVYPLNEQRPVGKPGESVVKRIVDGEL